ncbi:MAG: XRE family transcriptional regulator [Pseudomonadota bacterium]
MSTNGNPLNRGNLESSGSIDAKIALKAALMIEVSNWIAENNLTQEDAAVVLGISRQQISDVVAQKLSEFTVDTLVSMLIRAGKKVSVSVSSFDPNQTTISCWSEPKNRRAKLR